MATGSRRADSGLYRRNITSGEGREPESKEDNRQDSTDTGAAGTAVLSFLLAPCSAYTSLCKTR